MRAAVSVLRDYQQLLDFYKVDQVRAVATSAVLTLIAYRFLLSNLLPRLPYMTRMDYLTSLSTILVFAALIEVVVTSALGHADRSALGRKLDRAARLLFPGAFAVLCAWSFLL